MIYHLNFQEVFIKVLRPMIMTKVASYMITVQWTNISIKEYWNQSN